MKKKYYTKLLLDEASQNGQQQRKHACSRLFSELQHHMLHELCWADQENELIEKLLGLMMNINALMRQTLRERSIRTANAADIFINPKKLTLPFEE